MKKKYISLMFLVLVYLSYFLTTRQSVNVMNRLFFLNTNDTVTANPQEKDQIVVVIDPGHGGRDPGKVGVNNALEKDINLSISFKLKNLLEHNDIKVIMIREEDIGLYSETDRNKKNADLNNRIEIIHTNNTDLAISIHQNSFQAEYVRGAQVFYHKQSEEGKRLAELVQEQLKSTIDDGNRKKAKSNSDYYMLRKTNCPFIIVECGFLSNYEEANLLIDEEYQEKIAWGIHLGVMNYINEKGLR